MEIGSVLHYQTCDDEICYVPAELTLTFELDVLPLDDIRASEDIRR